MAQCVSAELLTTPRLLTDNVQTELIMILPKGDSLPLFSTSGNKRDCPMLGSRTTQRFLLFCFGNWGCAVKSLNWGGQEDWLEVGRERMALIFP